MQEAIRAVVDRIRDRHNARAPAKGGKAATHPLLGDESRLKRLACSRAPGPGIGNAMPIMEYKGYRIDCAP